MDQSVIKNPRITEKGSALGATNGYVFDVKAGANKEQIKKAIFLIYNVNPTKVNIISVPAKKINNRGRVGIKKGGRKAVVYLKQGDKIEFV